MKKHLGVFSPAVIASLLLGACSEHTEGAVAGIEQAATSVTAGTVTATLETTSSWSGGFCQSVTLKNTGTAITGWTLNVATNGSTISSLWSASQTTSGTTMTVTPSSYSASIPNGGSVNFGYCGSGNSLPTLSNLTVTGGGSGTGGASSTGGTTSKGGTTATGGTTSKGGTTATGGSKATGGTTATGGVGGAWPPSATFNNPVLWEDLADTEVIRVDDTYYYTASNMHYSPGAPILRSWDLVNWEYAGHAVPVLDFASKYNLSGGQAYVKGTYASTLTYRKSNKTFYWLGCIEYSKTYVYTATSVEGPWAKHSLNTPCYYDAGYLVDDDDTMYVAYGNTTLNVAQMSADGLSQVKTQQVYKATDMTLEGSHFFKRNGYYYITVTRPPNGEFVLRSTSPFGTYTRKTLVDNVGSPVSGSGAPHQGSLVQTQKGNWYYMGFVDAYPGGRIPVLAPVTWSSDGWPSVTLVNGRWGASYPYPDVPRPPREVKAHTGTETFSSTTLGHDWEWNHNPDNTKWSVGSGLKLQTATVTSDLYKARNTLTHRILGPQSTGTIQLDISGMKDGDVAGLALLRQSSAYIAVKKSGGTTKVTLVTGLSMDTSWNTTSTGTEVTSVTVTGNTIWLRLTADITPGTGKQGKFSYSTNGTTFTSLGSAYTMNNSWEFFMGYRFGIFNYATSALGGIVTVKSFTLTKP